MDKKTMTPMIILAVVSVGAGLASVFLSMDRAALMRKNSELDARVLELQRELETVKAADQSLRTEMMQAPPQDKPSCIDSDAKYGAEAIYIRGTVRSGWGQSSDHCRLGQLVEFTCIENPAGSGRFLVDAKIQDCPRGSRCVDGECLR